MHFKKLKMMVNELPVEKLWKVTGNQSRNQAELWWGNERQAQFLGNWVTGKPWDRFGLYNHIVAVKNDGSFEVIPAHAGELVPGSTEDLKEYLTEQANIKSPECPFTLELDPTYACASKDCGGHCFSRPYRRQSINASIPSKELTSIIECFAKKGGKVLRFDGGGDPLLASPVRNGELVELASNQGLKSTILTSGDLISATNLERIGSSNCYLRISLNAASDETRSAFHQNNVKLSAILKKVESFSQWLHTNNPELPIGATYLLGPSNFHEVLESAKLARDTGFAHFSARRVLGPNTLRSEFTETQLSSLADLLHQTNELNSEEFRVFVPWRNVNEQDINPSAGDFTASRCWQSTFKTIIEPDSDTESYRSQLCGRYRGGGVGQVGQMPKLFSGSSLETPWTTAWKSSFEEYKPSRSELPQKCSSCIDRGFITMIDKLIKFLGDDRNFEIFHLNH